MCCQPVLWNVGLSPQRAQPLSFVASGPAGNSKETASDKLEEVGMTSSHHGPLRPGLHVLQWRIQEATSREQADLKVRRSPD